MDLRNVTGLIVSGERSGYSVEYNALQSAKLVNALLDAVGFDAAILPLEGAWEGTREQSYLVVPVQSITGKPLEYRDLLYKVIAIASEFDQDAVMSVHDGSSYLIELPPVPRHLSREARMQQLYGIMSYDKGDTLLSDPLTVWEAEEGAARIYGSYTKIGNKYYVMLPE